eukprot:TRINITY_DN16179_c0_g1::TRINITY_DN16179_c0_g1_i1::g.6362::m.6362 TRINITY_DN16179_c0_g1::TRINITY_DN16179_c0_g1_i1::g.6362  ORF type:complete len:353 (-),score=39.46,EmrE/PF13536.1/3e-08,EmrE/PF13536.1/2.5e+03,EmrE/PF13536.1/1.6e+02,EamA/PF00892.15/8.4e-07,EamA/PF00892.15/1.4,DUF2177/PF09945.4/3.6e+02,DUF2177/PF09945.4/0.39,DUF2177/PF09945.4/4.1e+02,RseC_MucC/PF04246.7/4.9e+03,RseC_MucC/PF04246.7/2.5,RseC_MucC/PF04246.7/2.7e+03,RseC_MucC/PF04246.7/9.3 TRINITY_DN16179_c0_g1_i1:148-1206(-)
MFQIFDPKNPLFITGVYLIMLSSMFFASSAFIAMDELRQVRPILRTAWRAHVTTIALTPAFLWELYGKGSFESLKNMNQQKQHYVMKWTMAAAIGFLLYNFLFSWALDTTSLLNVMLLTNTSPLLVAFAPLLICRGIDQREGSAAFVGFAGGALAAWEGSSAGESSVAGDFIALLGAVASIMFIESIGHLRRELPLFTSMYLFYFALSIISAILCLLSGCEVYSLSNEALLGWMGPEHRSVLIYLALGPGLVAQSGMNFSVRYMSTLVMTLMVNTEPVFGTLTALAIGRPTYLGLGTVVGGGMLLGAAAYVAWITRPEAQRQKAELKKKPSWDKAQFEAGRAAILPAEVNEF